MGILGLIPMWRRFLFVAVLLISIAPASVATAQPSAYGRHQETVEDLRVKVVGGFVAIQRSWRGELSRWEFFPNLQNLALKGEGADGLPTKISRGVFTYEKATGSTVPLWRQHGSGKRVTYALDHFRWENEGGDWIEYDSDGQLIRFGRRTVLIATIERDSEGRIEILKDHQDQAVLTVEYESETGELVRAFDYSGRQVLYDWEGQLREVTDVRGFTWQYGYAEGRLVTKTDPRGRVTTITYAVDGTVTSIRDQDGFGTEYRYTYDSTKNLFYAREERNGNVVTETWTNSDREVVRRDFNGRTVLTMRRDREDLVETDENGYETRTVRDALGRVVGTVFPDGSSIKRKLGAFGLPVSIVNENGVETRFVNDANGNPIEMIEAYGRPEARVTLKTFDQFGHLVERREVVDGEDGDRVTSYQHDEFGNVIRITDAEVNVTEYQHDVLGNVTERTDTRGKVWLSELDPAGNLIRTEDPLGNETIREYDGAGNLVQFVDEEEAVTLYAYDRQGRLTEVTDALGNPWRYEYGPAGLLAHEIDPEGHTVSYRYDPDGRMTEIKDEAGNVTTVAYFPARSLGNPEPTRLKRTVYPTFIRERRYDSRHRLVAESDIDSENVPHPTSYAYDAAGNLRATISPDGRMTELSYDALNRLTARALINGRLVQISRDTWDQSVGVTDPRQNTTTLSFDKLGRRVAEARPSGKTTSFDFDAAGNLTMITDPRQMRVETIYDDAGRKQQEKMWPSLAAETPSKTITYSYNRRGELTGWDDGELSGTFAIDALGREIGSSVNYGPFTKGASNTYYKNGLTKTFTGPDEITYGYLYDNANRLRAIDIPNEGKLIHSHFLWKVPIQVTLPGGTVQAYEYDDFLRMTRAHSRDPAGNTIMDQRYDRDINGRVFFKTTEDGTYEYGYDDAYQLISVSSDATGDESYEYDVGGNRLPADTSSQLEWVYNEDNELRSTDGALYDYDQAGNRQTHVTTENETRYFYDEQGRLVRIETPPGSAIAEYGYDPFHRRIWKNSPQGRTHYYYSPEGLAAEFDSSGSVTRAFGYTPDSIWGTAPLFLVTNGHTYHYHRDYLGTPQRLTSVEGRVVWSGRYSGFGIMQTTVEQVTNPLGFPGQYRDAESSLHQNWHRYYDARTGHYLVLDPLRLKLQSNATNDLVRSSRPGAILYEYGLNDPINVADPTGLQSGTGSPIWDCIAITKDYHLDRNRMNNCPSTEPSDKRPDCEGRKWKFQAGKWRAGDGSECSYNPDGTVKPDTGEWAMLPGQGGYSFNFAADPRTLDHICKDVMQHYRYPYRDYTPGLTRIYDCPCE